MEEKKKEEFQDPRAKKAFILIFAGLRRYRRSLVNLYRIVRRDRQRLRELEKRVSSFIEPN